MAETGTITICRGESVTIPFAFTTATNITGWTIKMTVARSPTLRSPNTTTKLVGPVTCTHTNEISGTFAGPITAAESAVIEPATYIIDAWRTDLGSERCLFVGLLVVEAVARLPE